MPPTSWLLLVTNLSGRNQAVRMRLWRSLKAAGAALLRDGVYLLPESAPTQREFTHQASQILAAGGAAQVLTVRANEDQSGGFRLLFDRSRDYTALQKRIDAFSRGARRMKEPEARRQLTTLRRDLAALAAIDFFGSGIAPRVDAALTAAEHAVTTRFSPEEPHTTQQPITHRRRRDYQNRRWATRRDLWVDRVCSAWLIRRFIDKRATFAWLASLADLPRGAIGFDFDGAEFSHVGERVTFEVLLASFGLQENAALSRMGELVRSLDVGGVHSPEAAGLVAVLTGARSRSANDDALIKAIFPVLDLLLAGFETPDDGR